MNMELINKEQFREDEIGNVVYWYRMSTYGKWIVEWGILTFTYSSDVEITKYQLKDCRLVDGILYSDYPSIGEWKKIPKSLSNKDIIRPEDLVNITQKEFPEWVKNIKINDIDSIQKAIKEGYLVSARDNTSDSVLEVQYSDDFRHIGVSKGQYRLVKKSYYDTCYVNIEHSRVYRTYDDAKKMVDSLEEERQRIINMSDYEYAVYDINNKLGFFQKNYNLTDEEIEVYRKFLVELAKEEEIDVRIFSGHVEYKPVKNKRWKVLDIKNM